jgi:alpha-tubulin suppressor-like RCC1 family protein
MCEFFNNSTKTKFFIGCVLVALLVLTGGCTFQSPPANDTLHNGSPRFTAISSVGDSGLALRADGRIMCWGRNHEGFCDIPSNLTDAKSISSMNFAVKKDGTVAAWGSPRLYPVVPPNLTGVVAITRSQLCNIALKNDGTVAVWRAKDPMKYIRAEPDIQLARIANQSDLTSISGNLGLKKDGTVVSWYVNYQNISEDLQSSSLPVLSNIIAVSNQGDHFAALRKDGTVVAWKLIPDTVRENALKVSLIHAVENLSDIRAISAGVDHSLALKRDGTVITWTDDSLRSTGLTGITAISVGSEFDLALKDDGSIIAWGGDNKYGQLFTPGKLSDVKSISSGFWHNIILRNDGTITTWGEGLGTLCCLYGHEPEGIRNVTGVLAEGFQNIILENNNTIYGWGEVEFGPYPVKQIPHPYLTLFGGGNALFALKNGNLVVLSYNATNYNISQRLDNVTDVSSVFGQHTVALKNDGTVSVWGGDNWFKENEVPGNLSGVVAVSTGLHHDLALKNDGTVVGWGEQTHFPKGLSDVTAIAAGTSQSLALKKDGTVVAWGQTVIPDWNG